MYYICVLKSGAVIDFDKQCDSIEEFIPNVITFKDTYGQYLASIPRENIWTIFNGALENHEPFYPIIPLKTTKE